MPKRPKLKPLYFCREEDDGPEWLDLDADSGMTSRKAKESEITLEEMVNMLDQDAESINAHDFVTCHRGLAALLFQEVGREKATAIFRRLADFRGLHGMLEICGRGDSEAASKALGVPLNDWSDWSLKD